MAITFFQTVGAMKRFTGRRWGFQETFKTPMKALELFVRSIVQGLEPIEGGVLTLGEVVSEPKHFNALLAKHGLEVRPMTGTRYLFDWTVSGTGRAEVRAMMVAALGDCADFLFVPSPGRFVVFADHDEHTTLLSMSRGGVGGVARKMSGLGFERVKDFQRRF